MAYSDKSKNSVGVVRKGAVIKDQGFVPYEGPKEEATPNVSTGSVVMGQNRGMGEALRGGTFWSC